MYVQVCVEGSNFLNWCSITYLISEDRSIYVRLFPVIYWFLCLYVVLRKDLWVLIGCMSCMCVGEREYMMKVM